MLKILWKREEIAPEEQFLLLSTIFCHLMLDFCVKTKIRFSLRDKRLFEITEVEITRVDCSLDTFPIFSSAVFEENVKLLSQPWRRRRRRSRRPPWCENFDIF